MDARGPLPPGWDMKFDKRTGRYYFINHYTKTTSWEDPREKYQQIGKPTAKDNKENQKPIKEENEKQENRGGRASSPGTTTSSHRRAASPGTSAPNRRSGSPAGPSGTGGGMTSSLSGLTSQASALPAYPYYSSGATGSPIIQSRMPMASPQPLARLQLEEAGLFADSPLFSQRSTLRRDSQFLAEIAEMESTAHTSEQAISRIAALFPTVEEPEIRDLYKKYHGSQAVVISALQVAKHPLNTPGPASVFTPPPSRHATLPGVSQAMLAGVTMTGSLPYNFQNNMTPLMGARDISGIDPSSGYPTPRPGTAASDLDTSLCMGSPQISASLFRSLKPHSSPKMKLRYLKSVFPTVEEYLLLDVLANSENNVQKASDRLVKMGYVKRDAPSAPRLHAKKKAEERLAEKRTPLIKPPPIKTDAEKDVLRNKMKDKYEKKYDIPERILFMALESVLYDEEQANNLITAMIEDDLKRQKEKESKQKEKESERARERAEKKKSPKPVRKAIEPVQSKSPKHEPSLGLGGRKGAGKGDKDETDSKTSTSIQEGIAQHFRVSALAKGPNPDLCKGPNDDLLLTEYIVWNGPNASLRKGPDSKLANGPSMINRKGPMGASNGPNPANRKGPQIKPKGSMIQNYEDRPRRSA